MYTLAASVAAHIIFILIAAITRKPLKLNVIEQLTVIYTNGGILVVPLIKALLGDEYVIYSWQLHRGSADPDLDSLLSYALQR